MKESAQPVPQAGGAALKVEFTRCRFARCERA
jgi:hypothetical protein